MSTKSIDSSDRATGGGKALIAGGLSALLASACCLGPLVLIMLGISGAWISTLTLLEPYQPLFIGAATIALIFAARRIWRPVVACEAGQVCQRPMVPPHVAFFQTGECPRPSGRELQFATVDR